MDLYLAVDGGGTKIEALLFDSRFNLLGRGRSGQINTNFTAPDVARAHMAECLGQVFKGRARPVLQKVYGVFIGPWETFLAELDGFAEARAAVRFNEGAAAALAGAVWADGYAALAGTGSDVFCIRAGENTHTVGGWGGLLGDDGSGVAIGMAALRAAVRHQEGWGSPTVLRDLFIERWQLKDLYELVGLIYGAPSPLNRVAMGALVAAEAAAMGDRVALGIYKEAGRDMALQASCCIGRAGDGAFLRAVACGGAWKGHRVMFETFRRELMGLHPGIEVRRAMYEIVMAGPMTRLIQEGAADGGPEAVRAELKHFSQYAIQPEEESP